MRYCADMIISVNALLRHRGDHQRRGPELVGFKLCLDLRCCRAHGETRQGRDVERQPEEAKAISGFIPDRPFIYEKLSGFEFLEFVGKLHRVDSVRLERRILDLLERFELVRWKDELVESYSHGMKQRLVVCASLIHEPRILVVDEPMVGMDPKGARKLKDLFRSLSEQGTTVFLSTHSIGVAEEVCHRIGIIQRGRLIACGTMADLYAQAQTKQGNLESVFLELTQDNPADAVQPE